MKKTTLTLMSCFFLGLSGFTVASAADIVTVDNHYTGWFGNTTVFFKILSGANQSDCTIKGQDAIGGYFSLHPYKDGSNYTNCNAEPCKVSVTNDMLSTSCQNQSTFYIQVASLTSLSTIKGPYSNGISLNIKKIASTPDVCIVGTAGC